MSKQFKILFPTEFGPLGEKAKDNAVNLAKLYDAELILLHAIHIPSGITKLFSDVSEDEVRKRAQKAMEKYKVHLDPKGELSISTLIKIGEPEISIVETAKEIECQLIIFGTKGGSGLRDTLLGSAVNYVIRHCPCPVITIRNKPEYLGFKRILVPLDLAQEAGEKVSWGVRLAKKFGAELSLYSAVSGSANDMLTLQNRLNQATEYAKDQGLDNVTSHIAKTDESSVANNILEYADEVDADLICIMTQQESETGLRKTILGSVADRLVNISQRPVISIRPERHYHTKSWQSHHFT